MKAKHHNTIFTFKLITMKYTPINRITALRILASLATGFVFMIFANKAALNWEFWVFVGCLGAYGFLCRIEGRQESEIKESDIRDAVLRVQAEQAREKEISDLIASGDYDEVKDGILDKINFSGVDSLTVAEKEFLKQLSVK